MSFSTYLSADNARLRRLIAFALIVVVFSCALSTSAWASTASDSAFQNAITAIHKAYNILTSVMYPVATLVFSINVFRMLFAPSYAYETAKKAALTVFFVMVIIWLSPYIVEIVGNQFSSKALNANVWDKPAFT